MLANGYLRVEGDLFRDPDGKDYQVRYMGVFDGNTVKDKVVPEVEPVDHIIYYYQNAKCNNSSVVQSTGARKVAYKYRLESGQWYCGNN